MDKITFTTPLSDDEANEYDRRMEALFGGGADEPEHFESVGVSDQLIAAAECERAIVQTAYDTVMQLRSFQSMDPEKKQQFRQMMSLESTWKYIEVLKSIIDMKDKENDKLRRELTDAKKEIRVQMSADKSLDASMDIEGVIISDIDLRQMSSGTSAARFGLKISRNGKDDFINCTAWHGAAEFAAKYYKKGDRVVVTGVTDGLRVGNIRKTDGEE